jgi:hypothetical protein
MVFEQLVQLLVYSFTAVVLPGYSLASLPQFGLYVWLAAMGGFLMALAAIILFLYLPRGCYEIYAENEPASGSLLPMWLPVRPKASSVSRLPAAPKTRFMTWPEYCPSVPEAGRLQRPLTASCLPRHWYTPVYRQSRHAWTSQGRDRIRGGYKLYSQGQPENWHISPV